MHPYVREQLVRLRVDELRTAAGRYRQRRPRHRWSARQRAGWVLIEIGLRLTSGAGDA